MSRHPGTSEVTIAFPQAAASNRALGTPSPPWDGRQTSVALTRSHHLLAQPHHSTNPASFHALRVPRGIPDGLAGSTSPTNTNFALMPCCLNNFAASTNSATPLFHNILEGKITCGSPGGSGTGWNASQSTPAPRMRTALLTGTFNFDVTTSMSSAFCKMTCVPGRFSRNLKAFQIGNRNSRALKDEEATRYPRPQRLATR